MTVAELIAELAGIDPHLSVLTLRHHGDPDSHFVGLTEALRIRVDATETVQLGESYTHGRHALLVR